MLFVSYGQYNSNQLTALTAALYDVQNGENNIVICAAEKNAVFKLNTNGFIHVYQKFVYYNFAYKREKKI